MGKNVMLFKCSANTTNHQASIKYYTNDQYHRDKKFKVLFKTPPYGSLKITGCHQKSTFNELQNLQKAHSVTIFFI